LFTSCEMVYIHIKLHKYSKGLLIVVKTIGYAECVKMTNKLKNIHTIAP